MKKKLPSVYANPLDKEFKNTQEIFYSEGSTSINERNNDMTSILVKINRIFNSPHHVYKSNVRITMKDEIVEKVIVGKTSGNLLTLDGEKIKIIDILDIEKI